MTNQSYVYEEIESRMKSGNASYSMQNFCLPGCSPKNIKVEM